MRHFPHRTPITLTLLTLLLPGCRLPGREGPVSESLANCRQLSQRGVAAMEHGQHKKAEELLAQAVETCPVDSSARRYYAETLWHRGARQEAVAQLEEATRLAGEDAALHVRLAEMYLAIGRMEPARQHIEEALDLDPKLPTAWAMRGRMMAAAGYPQQALAAYHRALGYAAGDRQVLLEVAELYRQLNQPQRALATLQSLADTYSPGEEPQQVLFLTGLAHRALKRYDDAVRSFSAAVIRERPNAEILYHLGEAELLAGRLPEAAAAAQQALSLTPQHAASRDLLRRVELARRPPRGPQR